MKLRSFGLVAAWFLGSRPARAEPPEVDAPSSSTPAIELAEPPTPAGPPNAGAVAEAQARFRRALELHDEGNLDATRAELRRAYETAPNYKVLFNLAQVEFELLDYPAALATFEKYLGEGGDRIPKDRRAQVQTDIEKLRGRLGSIEIAVNVAGSRVAVDDAAVGTTPLLQPVLVSAGRRRITVSRAGYASETRVVDIAGGDRSTMSFELIDAASAATALPAASPPATNTPTGLAIEAPAPAAVAPGGRSSIPWTGWAATAVLAGGAGVTGAFALQRSQRLSSERTRYGIEPSDLDRLQREATTFAVVSDICAGTAAFAGLVSLYLTLSSNDEHKTDQGRAVRVSPSLGFVSVEGSF